MAALVAACAVFGAALLGLALWRAARGKIDPTLLCGAFAAFLYEGSQMFSPSFFYAYFGVPPADVPMLCRELALMNLMGLLLCKPTGRRRSGFYQVFCPLAAAGTAITVVFEAVSGMASGYLAARTEARLLAQQSKLSRQSYEAMRRQSQEVMLLRHDMAKHCKVLRQMTKEPQAAGYLDGLIGENEKIRPVIQSGNETMDIILNSKLSEAAGHGIAVETVRAQAPESLPQSDAELCSLVMNIMDNAIEAPSAPGVERRHSTNCLSGSRISFTSASVWLRPAASSSQMAIWMIESDFSGMEQPPG